MIPSINYVTAVLYNSLLRQRLRYEPKIVFGNMGDNSWPNKCNPIFSCITFSWKKSLLNSDSKYGANILFFIAINVVFCSSSSLLEIFFTLLVVKRKEKKNDYKWVRPVFQYYASRNGFAEGKWHFFPWFITWSNVLIIGNFLRGGSRIGWFYQNAHGQWVACYEEFLLRTYSISLNLMKYVWDCHWCLSNLSTNASS